MLDHGEAKVLLTDTEFAPTWSRRARARAKRKPLVIDIADAQGPGGERCRRDRLRSAAGRRRSRIRVAAARRRVGGDLAQLHVGHHGQPEGRRLSPPRRLSQRAVQHHRLGHAAACGLPVDAAAVPLQRLVLRVDDGRQRGHQRVPAQGGGEGDLRRDSRALGHALLRRADRALAADQRAGGNEARHHAQGVRRWSRPRRRRPR